jgi:hypothetical protein
LRSQFAGYTALFGEARATDLAATGRIPPSQSRGGTEQGPAAGTAERLAAGVGIAKMLTTLLCENCPYWQVSSPRLCANRHGGSALFIHGQGERIVNVTPTNFGS